MNFASDGHLRLRRATGVASLVSGAAMLLGPNLVGRLYGFPLRARWMRLLGLREVAVGWGLLHGGRARAWWLARSLSDALDAALIVQQRARGRTGRWGALFRFGVATAGAAEFLRLSRASP